MIKLVQAVSIVALAAAASTAGAWYANPYLPAPTQEQQAALIKQQQVMVEQQTKAMEQALATQRQFAEQQAARLKEMQSQEAAQYPFVAPPFGAAPAFPEMPPMTAFGQYPALPPVPEFGQIPAMPEMPAVPSFDRQSGPESLQARLKEMDAYRAQAKQRLEEQRAAMKNLSEQRRAMHPSRAFGRPLFNAAPGMHPAVSPTMPGAPVPQQQAKAPADKATATQ